MNCETLLSVEPCKIFDLYPIDTFPSDIWQWSELTSYGDLPSPRDFAAASAIGNRKIVMYVLFSPVPHFHIF